MAVITNEQLERALELVTEILELMNYPDESPRRQYDLLEQLTKLNQEIKENK